MPFADFQALYKQKLTTADEAVKIIKSGDWVDYGFCAIHPRVLDEALARRAPELEDVRIINAKSTDTAPIKVAFFTVTNTISPRLYDCIECKIQEIVSSKVEYSRFFSI